MNLNQLCILKMAEESNEIAEASFDIMLGFNEQKNHSFILEVNDLYAIIKIFEKYNPFNLDITLEELDKLVTKKEWEYISPDINCYFTSLHNICMQISHTCFKIIQFGNKNSSPNNCYNNEEKIKRLLVDFIYMINFIKNKEIKNLRFSFSKKYIDLKFNKVEYYLNISKNKNLLEIS